MDEQTHGDLGQHHSGHNHMHRKKCCGKHRGYGHHTIGGGIWFIGWLFTIGYLHLSFWSGVLGIILWPYFLGVHFAL